ncbi:mitochondrial amidoxime reducing component 2 isoform X2 [Condylostylus longicornis]|nr:mitochondrial amidoxime reducing component 2 isoform X2 [Condylostylus longicornis]
MLLAAGLGIGATAIAGWYYQNRKQFIPPTEWKRIGVLEKLYYYPIKSCYPIVLDTADCDDIGLRNGKFKDHQFMLIDTKNNLITCRTYPKLLKVKPKIINGELYATAPNMEPLRITYEKFVESNKGDVKVKFYKVDVYVTLCGEEYDKWFSKYILDKDDGIRLAYYPYPMATKLKDPSKEFATKFFRNEDTGSFQDVSSYMLINYSSVDELNTRLETRKEANVDPLAFRGNFYIKTDDNIPFDEDNWKWIKIGDDVIMRTLAPCYRCIVPNIDPEKAERNPNTEPLKTLKTYRIPKGSTSPMMGLQLGIRQNGKIKRGDTIYVSTI